MWGFGFFVLEKNVRILFVRKIENISNRIRLLFPIAEGNNNCPKQI